MPVSVSAASECIRICHDSGFFCGEMGFVALYLFFGYAGSLLQPASFLSLRRVGASLELQCMGFSYCGALARAGFSGRGAQA